MKYGYARVSTDDQNSALTKCLKALRHGDTLIVWKLDRFGRSLRDLITMLDNFRAQGVTFQFLTEHIDTETAAGRTMWQMIGVLSELEHSLITEYTRAGVHSTKRLLILLELKPGGARQQITYARQLRERSERVQDITDLFKISHMTVSRSLATDAHYSIAVHTLHALPET